MKKLLVNGLLAGVTIAAGAAAQAAPVTYTLQTVSDGMLGNYTFYEAPVTLTFRGDTSNVELDTSDATATVYKITLGKASVSVNLGGKVIVGHFMAGQVFVRYDTTRGIVGFGSGISPTYPLTLGCGSLDCTQGVVESLAIRNGIAPALADIAANPADSWGVNLATRKLPASLVQSTLLTGYSQACPIPYAPVSPGSSIIECLAAPATPLSTDLGPFYLQDLVPYDSVYYGNTGVFTVKVLPADD